MKQLSLTYKLFILVFVVSVSTLGLYSFTVLNDFTKDKLAYVFDSSLGQTKATALQTQIELEAILSQVKQVMVDYSVSEKKFGELAKKTITDSQKITAIFVYDGENQQLLDQAGQIEVAEKKAISSALDNLIDNNFSIQLLPGKTNSILIGTKHDSDEQSPIKILCLINNVHFLSQLLDASTSSTYLLDSDNRIWISPMKSVTFNHDSLIQQLPKSANLFGVNQFEAKNGEQFIVSYARTSIFDLQALSITPYNSVLKIIDSIKQQSIYFALFLVGLVIIVSFWSARTLTSNLKTLLFATEQVGRGELNQKIDISARDEIGRLASSFNKMVQDLKFLLNETAEKGRMESELKTAQLVQATLFPPQEFKTEKVELYGFYESASECGGDWWHHKEIDDKLFIWIGDATGHGAPAALVASAAKSASSIIEKMPNQSPEEILKLLNHAIASTSKGQVTMTFFLACLDLKSGQLRYSNASHESPFLFKSKDKPLGNRSAECVLGATGRRIGEKTNSVYELNTLTMEPGDRLFLYTDGITELNNSQNDMYGERRLLKVLTQSFNDESSAKTSCASLRQSLDEFRKDYPLQDDVTFVMVDFLKTKPK